MQVIDLCSPPPKPLPPTKPKILSPNKAVRFVIPKETAGSTMDSGCYIVEREEYKLDDNPDCKVIVATEDNRTILRENRVTKVNPNDDDDDLLVLGTQGSNVLTDCPHARSDCVIEPFVEGNFEKHCQKCYCWVCDVPAKDCNVGDLARKAIVVPMERNRSGLTNEKRSRKRTRNDKNQCCTT